MPVMIIVITRVVSYSSSFALDTFSAVSSCEMVGVATPSSGWGDSGSEGSGAWPRTLEKKAFSACLQTLDLTHIPCHAFYEMELKIL